MGLSGQRHSPGNGPAVLIGYEAGWASVPVWTQRLKKNSFASAGYRTSVVQSVFTALTEIHYMLSIPTKIQTAQDTTIDIKSKYVL
jgi:hypothetical protein